jgi:hypothetical protein
VIQRTRAAVAHGIPHITFCGGKKGKKNPEKKEKQLASLLRNKKKIRHEFLGGEGENLPVHLKVVARIPRPGCHTALDDSPSQPVVSQSSHVHAQVLAEVTVDFRM